MASAAAESDSSGEVRGVSLRREELEYAIAQRAVEQTYDLWELCARESQRYLAGSPQRIAIDECEPSTTLYPLITPNTQNQLNALMPGCIKTHSANPDVWFWRKMYKLFHAFCLVPAVSEFDENTPQPNDEQYLLRASLMWYLLVSSPANQTADTPQHASDVIHAVRQFMQSMGSRVHACRAVTPTDRCPWQELHFLPLNAPRRRVHVLANVNATSTGDASTSSNQDGDGTGDGPNGHGAGGSVQLPSAGKSIRGACTSSAAAAPAAAAPTSRGRAPAGAPAPSALAFASGSGVHAPGAVHNPPVRRKASKRSSGVAVPVPVPVAVAKASLKVQPIVTSVLRAKPAAGSIKPAVPVFPLHSHGHSAVVAYNALNELELSSSQTSRRSRTSAAARARAHPAGAHPQTVGVRAHMHTAAALQAPALAPAMETAGARNGAGDGAPHQLNTTGIGTADSELSPELVSAHFFPFPPPLAAASSGGVSEARQSEMVLPTPAAATATAATASATIAVGRGRKRARGGGRVRVRGGGHGRGRGRGRGSGGVHGARGTAGVPSTRTSTAPTIAIAKPTKAAAAESKHARAVSSSSSKTSARGTGLQPSRSRSAAAHEHDTPPNGHGAGAAIESSSVAVATASRARAGAAPAPTAASAKPSPKGKAVDVDVDRNNPKSKVSTRTQLQDDGLAPLYDPSKWRALGEHCKLDSNGKIEFSLRKVLDDAGIDYKTAREPVLPVLSAAHLGNLPTAEKGKRNKSMYDAMIDSPSNPLERYQWVANALVMVEQKTFAKDVEAKAQARSDDLRSIARWRAFVELWILSGGSIRGEPFLSLTGGKWGPFLQLHVKAREVSEHWLSPVVARIYEENRGLRAALFQLAARNDVAHGLPSVPVWLSHDIRTIKSLKGVRKAPKAKPNATSTATQPAAAAVPKLRAAGSAGHKRKRQNSKSRSRGAAKAATRKSLRQSIINQQTKARAPHSKRTARSRSRSPGSNSSGDDDATADDGQADADGDGEPADQSSETEASASERDGDGDDDRTDKDGDDDEGGGGDGEPAGQSSESEDSAGDGEAECDGDGGGGVGDDEPADASPSSTSEVSASSAAGAHAVRGSGRESEEISIGSDSPASTDGNPNERVGNYSSEEVRQAVADVAKSRMRSVLKGAGPPLPSPEPASGSTTVTDEDHSSSPDAADVVVVVDSPAPLTLPSSTSVEASTSSTRGDRDTNGNGNGHGAGETNDDRAREPPTKRQRLG